jgi:Ca-activated chloride channel family protein
LHADLVVLNVSIRDQSGLAVHGLKEKAFTLSEDGVAQKIQSFAAEEGPFAAAILVDMSESMQSKFGLVRAAAAYFVENIRDDDQVAVYGFNEKVRRFQDYTNARDISDYIWDATAEGRTRLYDCMDEAIETLAKRPELRRALVLITDGWDSSSGVSLDTVTKKSLGTGIMIYCLDLVDDDLMVGNAAYVGPLRRGRMDLRRFAADTGGQYIKSPQGDRLDEAFAGVVDELRNQYTLTYYSTNERRDGRWRNIAVNVAQPDVTIRTRRGYFAPRK